MKSIKDRKKYTLEEAHATLKNKKGAGTAKHTKINLSMVIEFDSGVDGARTAIESLPLFIRTLVTRQSEYAGFSYKNTKITDKSYVQTELEDNPDWNL